MNGLHFNVSSWTVWLESSTVNAVAVEETRVFTKVYIENCYVRKGFEVIEQMTVLFSGPPC